MESGKTLYESLGGAAAIDATVNGMYERILSDPVLQPFFGRTNMNWLKGQQAAFLTQALGGPAAYAGAGLANAHSGLGILDEHFDRVVSHITDTLSALGVDASLATRVLAGLAPLRADVVGQSGTT